MICPHCFKQVVDEGAEFCPYCGKQFVEDQPRLEGERPSVQVRVSSTPTSVITLSPDLVPNEQVLWKNDVYKGIFSRTLVRSYVVTNLRCYIIEAGSNKVSGQLAIARCDVIVMNSTRRSDSSGGGSFVASGGVGAYGSNRTSTSRTFGDLHFTSDGKQYMVFPGVADPSGVKKLIETLKKEYLKRLKADSKKGK